MDGFATPEQEVAGKVNWSEDYTESLENTGVEKAKCDRNALFFLQNFVYIRIVGVVVIIAVSRKFFLLIHYVVGGCQQKPALLRWPSTFPQLSKTWQLGGNNVDLLLLLLSDLFEN